MTEDKFKVWSCKLVVPANVELPKGADQIPRCAVVNAITDAGFEVIGCFSGWGGYLTKNEISILLDEPIDLGGGEKGMSEYAERDPRDLGEHYIKHVSAMTGEGLHSKAAIAAELAYRDAEIERLRAEIAQLKSEALPNEQGRVSKC